MDNANKATVFILYGKDDREAADFLARRLKEEGIETWLYTDNLAAGDTWSEEIEAAMDRFSVCLLLLGEKFLSTFSSNDHRNSFGGALNKGISRGDANGGMVVTTGMIGTIERRFKKEDLLVIPVVLPGANLDETDDRLPGFIKDIQWFKFSRTLYDNEAFKRLLAAIRQKLQYIFKDHSSIQNLPENGEIQEGIRVRKTILLPDIDWVEIPAGPFIFGEQDRQQKQELERFYISRYPTTNGQYQAFIEAGGYKDDHWWQDLSKPELKEPNWKQPNRPRESVNWYEAVAFTRWLSAQLGYSITLPTKQQWEKAARGNDGREYPWGAGFKTGDANVYDSAAGYDNLGQTAAVGLYPHRTSPYSVEDLAGNVWEWCLNKFGMKKDIDIDTNGDMRVIVGGSFSFDRKDARTSVSLMHSPGKRNSNIGFRVVSVYPFL